MSVVDVSSSEPGTSSSSSSSGHKPSSAAGEWILINPSPKQFYEHILLNNGMCTDLMQETIKSVDTKGGKKYQFEFKSRELEMNTATREIRPSSYTTMKTTRLSFELAHLKKVSPIGAGAKKKDDEKSDEKKSDFVGTWTVSAILSFQEDIEYMSKIREWMRDKLRAKFEKDGVSKKKLDEGFRLKDFLYENEKTGQFSLSFRTWQSDPSGRPVISILDPDAKVLFAYPPTEDAFDPVTGERSSPPPLQEEYMKLTNTELHRRILESVDNTQARFVAKFNRIDIKGYECKVPFFYDSFQVLRVMETVSNVRRAVILPADEKYRKNNDVLDRLNRRKFQPITQEENGGHASFSNEPDVDPE